jgi:hypothetical protein
VLANKGFPTVITRKRLLMTNFTMAVQLNDTIEIAASGWDDEPIKIQWQKSMKQKTGQYY